jgi:hypothetical protein
VRERGLSSDCPENTHLTTETQRFREKLLTAKIAKKNREGREEKRITTEDPGDTG